MDTVLHEELDYANYYAVELLTSVLGKIDPMESEIMPLEEQLKHKHCQIYTSVRQQAPSGRALVISADVVELNTLKMMLQAQGFKVECVDSRETFLRCVAFKKRYDVVIISDQFTEMGLNFFRYYFHSALRRYQTRLIHLAEQEEESKVVGFNAHLRRPFLLDDLIALLPRRGKRL